MKKEIIVCIIIVIAIIVGNIVTQNYTVKSIGILSEELEELKKDIIEAEENAEIEKYCQKLDDDSRENLKKIGLIRYNAYKDTGSNLSFALAILNENDTGIVLNGIYGRDTSNIYAKPVVNGKSEYALSKEEEQAINQVIKNTTQKQRKINIYIDKKC